MDSYPEGEQVSFNQKVEYGMLLEMRQALQKRYANGIMTRSEFQQQMTAIDKVIADAERGRGTGKVV